MSQEHGTPTYTYWRVALIAFAVGAVCSWIGTRWWDTRAIPLPITGKEFHLGKENLINPLLYCKITPSEETKKQFLPLKTSLQEIINKHLARKSANTASVYVYTLDTGEWLGIGEEDTYGAASLLKVPLMLTYLRLAEDTPSMLNATYVYDGKENGNAAQSIPPAETLVAGKAYSVADLILRMIVYSDNNASNILYHHVDKAELNKTYVGLGVPTTFSPDQDLYITPRSYSRFFRVLYNATYVSRSLSLQALQLLTKVDFKDGIVAGVPKDTPVAHKFGERSGVTTQNNRGSKELHDCGIVYHPIHPYFLCVMTSGEQIERLQTVIGDISKEAYTFIDTALP
jgi:beta-lactamase class A